MSDTSNKKSLLTFLLQLAAGTAESPGLPPITPEVRKANEEVLRIHADGAERTFIVALKWLGEIVAFAPHYELRSDVGLFTQLLNLAAKLDVLGAKISQLHLEVGGDGREVGYVAQQRGIMAFLRSVVNLFDSGSQVVNQTHGYYSIPFAVAELLKALDPSDPGCAERRERLLDLAEDVIHAQSGILYQCDDADSTPQASSVSQDAEEVTR